MFLKVLILRLVRNILRIENREIVDSTESLGFSFGKARASLHDNSRHRRLVCRIPSQLPGQTVIADQLLNILEEYRK